MSIPTALEQYEAAETAILELLTDPKASASFGGRSYTAQDLDKLQRVSEHYRSQAIQRGELTATMNEQPVRVSTAKLKFNTWES